MESAKFNPHFIYEGSISGKIRVAIKAAPPDSTKIASRHQTNKQIGTQHIRNEHYRVSPKHERHLEICLYLDTSNRNSNQPSTIS